MCEQTETKCNEAKLQYETINQTLTEEIPRLIESRVAFMDPVLVAFIRTQHKFYQGSAEALQPLNKYFGAEVGEVRCAALPCPVRCCPCAF